MTNRNTCKIILRNDFTYADGTQPIYLQAFIQKKRVRILLNINVETSSFDVKSGTVKKKYPNADKLNIIIGKALQKANRIILDAEIYDKNLNKEIFKAEFFESVTNHKSIIDFIKKEIDASIAAVNTVKCYKSTLKHLTDFKKEVTFGEVNYELVEDFDKYLHKLKLGRNTIHKYHKTFCSFINAAINKSIKVENPYKKFKITSVETEMEYLNFDELLLLMNLYDSGNLSESLHHVLRYYLFSCTCNGIRFSDIEKLTDDNIANSELVFTPVKTRNSKAFIRLPLTKSGQKYVDDALKNVKKGQNKTIFKCFSNQKTNAYLKEIALYAGIKSVSFHSARHTFASLFLTKSNDVATLQKLLGHAKLEQTMRYVHISQQQKITELAKFESLFDF